MMMKATLDLFVKKQEGCIDKAANQGILTTDDIFNNHFVCNHIYRKSIPASSFKWLTLNNVNWSLVWSLPQKYILKCPYYSILKFPNFVLESPTAVFYMDEGQSCIKFKFSHNIHLHITTFFIDSQTSCHINQSL